MTMPINTFQDILDALEQDHTLREKLREYILTQELLQMPAQIQTIILQIAELRDGQLVLQNQVNSLDRRTASLENTMESVEGRLEGVEGRLGSVEQQGRRMEGRLGNIEGGLYEQSVIQRSLPRATRMGISNPVIAFARRGQSRQQFYNSMMEAVERGQITTSEYDDLTEADVIIRGDNRRHAVFEASLGPDQDDIERALRRADILRRATGDEVIPGVIAPEASPQFIQLAESRNVRFIAVSV